MKACLVIVLLAVVAMAACQQDQAPAATGKLTPDQVVDKLNGILGDGVCINLACRRSCLADGHVNGYCLNNACTCVLVVHKKSVTADPTNTFQQAATAKLYNSIVYSLLNTYNMKLVVIVCTFLTLLLTMLLQAQAEQQGAPPYFTCYKFCISKKVAATTEWERACNCGAEFRNHRT
ncbi:hypothetical protein NQ315_012681 [Exocentrus adspersus]|uniref:Defensin n=1 Tax=Exocentrus adspersus TaxID=1586481 RepID=A0AAV8VT31_9CUCU|nr:hypothetical protein NQ315_012681 [Exocentrus adspersus]